MAAELQQQALEVHQRLLGGDPTAPLDAAQLLLDPLVNRLRRRWPSQGYLSTCRDAATEVLVTYLQAPDRYDPKLSGLLSWLAMQANGDLTNDYKSPQRTFERSWTVESALTPEGQESNSSELGDRTPLVDAVPSLEVSSVLAAVAKAFPNKRDRELIWLMCVDGERSTDAAADVLGLMELPSAERAAVVKREKDRVMRRMRRLGLDSDHD